MADPELANKQEWSILQYLESENRNGPTEPNVMLRKNISGSGYDAAGFVDAKASRRIWILTNSRISPRIKLMPPVTEILLTPQQVELILSDLEVSSEVKSFLTVKRH